MESSALLLSGWGLSSLTTSSWYHSPSLEQLGPLIFNPISESHTLLFSSPSLSPPLTPPPRLTLDRFLETSSTSSSLPPSVASSIASSFGSHTTFPFHHAFHSNCLRILPCPNNVTVAFFPTGDNRDQLGYLLLWMQDSQLGVRGGRDGHVIADSNKFHHPITLLLIQPAADFEEVDSAGDCDLVGYVMVCTMYSVQYFKVWHGSFGSEMGRPVLNYLGGKTFRSCAVVCACFSPYTQGEGVVFLQNGELFIFHLDVRLPFSRTKFRILKLNVLWGNDPVSCDGVVGWLGCCYAYHPRLFIVARRDTVSLLDLRYDECRVVCLASNDFLRVGPDSKEEFTAFTYADSGGYVFLAATKNMLLVYDVRKPILPVIQWMHAIESPCFIEVLSLSDVRAEAVDEKYNRSSEIGFCAIMGSFWNGDFGCFCYGPRSSEFLCQWGLPSGFSLSGRDCLCGDCLLSEAIWKGNLPVLFDWREKKELVTGFGILMKGRMESPSGFGGFTLIRLMSSGKLESQRYRASWTVDEFHHHDHQNHFGVSLLYSRGDEDYTFPRRFHYMKFDNLSVHLSGSFRRRCYGLLKMTDAQFSAADDCIEDEVMNEVVIAARRGSPLDVLRDVSLPLSVHEISCMRTWVGLPFDILKLAFSLYGLVGFAGENKSTSLEFVSTADQLEKRQQQRLPFILRKPSIQSNRWSRKADRPTTLIGPLLSTHALRALLALNENERVETGRDDEEEVMRDVKKLNCSSCEAEATAVSLEDDDKPWGGGGTQNTKPLIMIHEPSALLDRCSSASVGGVHGRFIFQAAAAAVAEDIRPEAQESGLFDDVCLVKLKFDHEVSLGKSNLKSLKLLKRQFVKWQAGVPTYQKFLQDM